jgi:hypothetical protein
MKFQSCIKYCVLVTPIIPALEAEAGDHEFEARLGYIIRPCLGKAKHNENPLYN